MSFYISEVIFFIICAIAVFVTWEFIKARNGLLRKIMIAYFATVVFTYGLAILYYGATFYGKPFIAHDLYIVIVGIPKACAMLWLLWYLKIMRKQT